MSRAYAQAEHARTEAEARAMQVRCCVPGCDSPERHDREAPRCEACDKPCCDEHLAVNMESGFRWEFCPACEAERLIDKAEQVVLDRAAVVAALIEIDSIVVRAAFIKRDELYERLQGISIRLQVAA